MGLWCGRLETVERWLGLRTKALLFILPLVITIVAASGTLASFASREAVTRVTTRLMAYKAEQLRDFAYSQWEVIEELGFEDDPDYRAAAEAAIQSYAGSLLRSETELVFALDQSAVVVLTSGGRSALEGEYPELLELAEQSGAGWFSESVAGAPRLGQLFFFEPFDWWFFVTELRSRFFTDVRSITTTHGLILLVAIIVATALVSLFVGFVIGPIERLSEAMRAVYDSGDLSGRVVVEYADEVGLLAQEFNRMAGNLEESYARLSETARAESAARRTALDREEETLYVLGRASEFRDAETGAHLQRVGELCALFSQLLGQSEEEQELLRRSAPLHDVGKIGIPDEILFSTGKLTPAEYETMKRHTVIGWQILRECESVYLRKGAEIALCHHEKWDGSGYPNGLRQEEIPLSGRIVGLVDVFDALTSERPYKRAWSVEEARDYIIAEAGTHFEPRLVNLFQEYFEGFRNLMEGRDPA